MQYFIRFSIVWRVIITYTNIIISDVSKYVPENKISNEYFINHFDNEGKDCRGLLRATQRDTRYFATLLYKN